MTAAFPHLLSPIRIGSRTATNRVMRVATTANLADANIAGPRLLAFYRTIAEGGTGTIVTEALRTQPDDPFGPGALVVFDRRGVAGLKALSQVCHAAGALLIGQLNMGGRQHLGSRVPVFSIAPSAIACPRSGGVPHELSDREVRETIEAYLTAAEICMEGGMDGVEIHGAQGHLIQQFLSPFSNHRSDDWGGSLENRLRFAREILLGTRRRLGSEAIVGFRLGVEEFTPGGLDIEATVDIARRFAGERLMDYLSLAQGNFNSIETHLPDRHWPILAWRTLHARFKPVANGIPVVASTRIQGPEQAEDVLAKGEADMIGLCRALIVDPEWTAKARDGQSSEIRRCIACNQCWAWIAGGESIACATNPAAGREHLFPSLVSDRVAMPQHVVVVGGGVAGLEAARVAALRGHRVTLIERSAKLGGRIARAHEIRHHEDMRNLLDFLIPAVARAGVDVRLETSADLASLRRLAPDAVVIATGATPAIPVVPGDGSVPIITSDGPVSLAAEPGQSVVIADEDGFYWMSAMAESVMEQGFTPVIVTRFFEVGRELPMVSRIAFLRAVDKAGGQLKPNFSIARIERGGVVLAHYLTGREERIEDVAGIVWTGAARANGGDLSESLLQAGFAREAVHVVGDAVSPRRISHAMLEAHRVARSIGGRR